MPEGNIDLEAFCASPRRPPMTSASYTMLPGGTCIWTPGRFGAAETRRTGIAYLAVLVSLTICAAAALLAWQSLV